ncbi:hypothetical protein [Undibacterium sp. TJN19]|uniref:hypothetical protein n=1 Tax=Undibacterium sp. TJN19 TaxID=3413055 RepID=UPI003BF31BBC
MHVQFFPAVFTWASLQVVSGLLLFLFSVHLFFSKKTYPSGYGVLLVLAGNFMLSRCSEPACYSALLIAFACAASAHFLSMAIYHPNSGLLIAIKSLQRLMGLVLALVAVDRILMSAHDCFSA